MRYLFVLFIPLLFSFYGNAQVGGHYSTKNKKAISLFQEAIQAPNKSIDPYYRIPNFQEGINLAQKAIDKDPNFWEAHLLIAEYYEKYSKYDFAVSHYEKALAINPNHAPSGSTLYYLGKALNKTGEYKRSNEYLEKYSKIKNANQALVNDSYKVMASNDFSIEAMGRSYAFEPKNMGPAINTAEPEYFPTITVDGKTILFTRRIKDKSVPMGMQEDFFYTMKDENGVWQEALPMPKNINTTNNEGAPTISADGRTLIFVACSDETGRNYGPGREGWGSCDLFYTKRIGSRWLDPINLPGKVNTSLWESQPSLSADGKTLYYIRRVSRPGETPNSDIYVSNLQADGNWSAGKPLPNYINTPDLEESVLIHPDGKTLYFASRGHVGMGGSDLFMCRMDEKGNWSKPVNLGYPINTKYDENSLMVDPTGEVAYFASNRKGGYGDLDIYSFSMPEHLRPIKTLYFEGTVFDAVTKVPLQAQFELIDLATGEQVILSYSDKVNGQFVVSLPIDKEYALNTSLPGYSFFSQNFNMKIPENQEAYTMDVPMIPIGTDIPVTLNNVFFDLAQASLRKESSIELNKLVDFMLKNPSLKIEISGHTDTRGDAKENLSLSQRRADTVVHFLIEKGIASTRLVAKGYGESKPIYSDDTISKMDSEKEKEAAHQANRRTEYRILKQ